MTVQALKERLEKSSTVVDTISENLRNLDFSIQWAQEKIEQYETERTEDYADYYNEKIAHKTLEIETHRAIATLIESNLNSILANVLGGIEK